MLEAILFEIEQRKNFISTNKLNTIYLGGGTPSLLNIDEIHQIFDTIDKHFDIGNVQECTLEANPDDLTKEYIKSLKSTPINRLSIGVQSFFDSDLKYMGRIHNAQDAESAIKTAQDRGFEQLTIDLIYGVPNMSHNQWLQNLSMVTKLQIPHFSAYALTVEERTILHHDIKYKKRKEVDIEQSAQQFEILMKQAPNMGFEQYEISNFAKQKKYAVHNTNYWHGIPYLGIGPSAHSFDGTNRGFNVANNSQYIKLLTVDKSLAYQKELLNNEQRFNEYVMTSLRTMWGCDLNKIKNEWGNKISENLENQARKFIIKKWIIQKEHCLILSTEGKLFADYIASEFFIVN